jgi:hypothetical protein
MLSAGTDMVSCQASTAVTPEAIEAARPQVLLHPGFKSSKRPSVAKIRSHSQRILSVLLSIALQSQ